LSKTNLSEVNGPGLDYDEKPIKSVTKTFEQLLEEQLANEHAVAVLEDGASKKVSGKFLKRGEGLSRFNLKENITPQTDWKPGSKRRRPLVDYSKPVPKPKPKEMLPNESKVRPVVSKQPSKGAKAAVAAPASRKVATVAPHSPTKPLRRSNTAPVKKADTKPLLQKRQSTDLSTAPAFSKQKSPLTSARGERSGFAGSASPRKVSVTPLRMTSFHDSSSVLTNKQPSPRKIPALSHTKSTKTLTTRSQHTSPSIAQRKPVDSSFYQNIQHRVKNEAVETEELEVGVLPYFC